MFAGFVLPPTAFGAAALFIAFLIASGFTLASALRAEGRRRVSLLGIGGLFGFREDKLLLATSAFKLEIRHIILSSDGVSISGRMVVRPEKLAATQSERVS